MDWRTFTVELLGATAWPLVVVVSLVVLRRELRLLLPLLSRLKWKDLEVEFGRHVAEVKAEVTTQLPPPDAALTAPPGDTLEALIAASPRGAIIEAWRRVEAAAEMALARKGGKTASEHGGMTSRLVGRLQQLGALDAQQGGFLHELRFLRNQAAHSPDFVINAATARDYVQAAERIARFLETT